MVMTGGSPCRCKFPATTAAPPPSLLLFLWISLEWMLIRRRQHGGVALAIGQQQWRYAFIRGVDVGRIVDVGRNVALQLELARVEAASTSTESSDRV